MGIPKAIRAMRENDSPLPRFDADENREYFTAILSLHPGARELDLGNILGGDLDGTNQVIDRKAEKAYF